jgi:hypothetical protein
MKKVSMLLIGLVMTLFSYSQDFSRIVKATKSEWRNDKWIETSIEYPKEAFVIIKDWDITIGTYKFKTYGDPEKNTYENHVTYTWKCVNANGSKCYFMMKKFRPEISSHMMYSIVYETGVMYEYEGE